jgi:hypothetical protein
VCEHFNIIFIQNQINLIIDTAIVVKITALSKNNVDGVLGQTYHHTNSSGMLCVRVCGGV